jgi:hypothetical protein
MLVAYFGFINVNASEKLVLTDKNTISFNEAFTAMFGIYKVEFSNCPLITAPLRVVSVRKGTKGDIIKFYNNIRNYVRYDL